MRISKLVLVAAALAPVVVLGADSVADTARRCTAVKDSLARLVCFDKAFETGAEGAAVAAPSGKAAPSVAAVVAPAAAAVVVAPALGDESLKKSATEAKAAEVPTELTANITVLRESRPGVYRITLDNGQIWQQMEMESLFRVEVGDTVRISKGSMGGYRMARISNGHSGWVRVTRSK